VSGGAIVICTYCQESLIFVAGRGYVHRDGGTYKMACPTCGWTGAPYPSPVRCPDCGSNTVRDDHCAQPARSVVPS
jgi:primosomal protein N'